MKWISNIEVDHIYKLCSVAHMKYRQGFSYYSNIIYRCLRLSANPHPFPHPHPMESEVKPKQLQTRECIFDDDVLYKNLLIDSMHLIVSNQD